MDHPTNQHLRQLLKLIRKEAEAALADGNIAVLKKTLGNIVSVARHELDTLADDDYLSSRIDGDQ